MTIMVGSKLSVKLSQCPSRIVDSKLWTIRNTATVGCRCRRTVCCQSVQLRLVESWNIFQCIQIFLSFIGECQPGHGGLDNSIKLRLPRQIAPPYDSHSKEIEFCRESAVPEQGGIFWWNYPGQRRTYSILMANFKLKFWNYLQLTRQCIKSEMSWKYGNNLKSRAGFYSAYLPLLGWGMIYLWSCVRQRSFSVRFPPLVRLWSMMAINPEAGTYTYTTTLYCRLDRFRNSMSSTRYNLPASLDNFTFLAQLTNWSTGSNHA